MNYTKVGDESRHEKDINFSVLFNSIHTLNIRANIAPFFYRKILPFGIRTSKSLTVHSAISSLPLI